METLEDVFVRVVGAERRQRVGLAVMWNQARAIVGRNGARRGIIFRDQPCWFIFSGVLLAFWYAALDSAVLAGDLSANTDEFTSVTGFSPASLLMCFLIGSSFLF